MMLVGTDRKDTLNGGNEDDLIVGRRGDDLLRGGGNADRIYGETGKDRIYGQSGDDRLFGGYQNDTIFGGLGDDSIYGQNDDDFLLGEKDDDFIVGGNGVDTLVGGSGNDTLLAGSNPSSGGFIDEYMRGGSGRDVFALTDGRNQFHTYPADPGFGNSDFVVIQDFQPKDSILLLQQNARTTVRTTQPRTQFASPISGNHTGIYVNDDLVALVPGASVQEVKAGLEFTRTPFLD